MEIPEPKNVRWIYRSKQQRLPVKSGVGNFKHCGDVRMQSPWLATIFMEKGLSTGLPMSPPVNYRATQFDRMTKWTGRTSNESGIPPFVHSLFKDPSELSFDSGNSPTLLMYQVEHQAADRNPEPPFIETVGLVNYQEQPVRFKSRNHRVTAVTNAAFKRTLLMFGFKWASDVDSDGNPIEMDDSVKPTEQDFYAFFKELSKVKISTNGELQAFVQECEADRWYNYEPDLKIEDNTCDFGEAYRGMSSVRLGGVEGNHRLTAVKCASIGQFNLDGNARVALEQSKSHDEMLKELQEEGVTDLITTLSDAKTYQPMGMRFTGFTGTDQASIIQEMKQLQGMGKTLIKEAKYQVKMKQEDVLKEILSELTFEELKKFDDGIEEDGPWFWQYDFERANDMVKRRNMAVMKYMIKVIEEKQLGPALEYDKAGSSKWEPEEVMERLTDHMNMDSELIQKDGRPRYLGMNSSIPLVLEVVRMSCRNKETLANLKKVVFGVDTGVKNGPLNDLDEGVLRSLDWLIQSLWISATRLGLAYTNGMSSDRYLLAKLMSSNKDAWVDQFMRNLKANGISDESCDMEDWKQCKAMVEKKHYTGSKLTEATRGPTKGKGMKCKLQTMAKWEFWSDALFYVGRTMWNPKLNRGWVQREELDEDGGKFLNQSVNAMLL